MGKSQAPKYTRRKSQCLKCGSRFYDYIDGNNKVILICPICKPIDEKRKSLHIN